MAIEYGAKITCDCCGASKFVKRISRYGLDPDETRGWKIDELAVLFVVLCPVCNSHAKFRGLFSPITDEIKEKEE